MNSRTLSFVILLLFAPWPLSAQTVCKDLHRPENIQEPLSKHAGEVHCTATETELQVCRWTYSLRDDRSRSLFETLRKRFSECPELLQAYHDVGVNHPDTYDAWEFIIADLKVVIALKDKSALDATFVTLRLKR